MAYFECEYCKGPLGADSTGHCRGCGAPLQKMPPLFNVYSLQQRTYKEAYSELGQWFSEQQNLGNIQQSGLENSLGHRTGLASMLLGGLR